MGYVGLPLAVEFAKHYTVVGIDSDATRCRELSRGHDHTDMIDCASLLETVSTQRLRFGTWADVGHSPANIYIVAVPTPIDANYQPDLTALKSSTTSVAQSLRRGDLVVYESTVYPGCTEEVCVPILESMSGLTLNADFAVGYSPERINPGDKVHTLTTIRKIVSGSTPEAADRVAALYSTIVTAGVHRAPSIKVAEAAKAIENAQRDVNISFINEVALICDRCGIDTGDVIDAASTKWNFLPFRPGLVGGHCISVDPYYLAQKAQSLGYNPDVILSGRRVNNSIAKFIADKTLKLIIRSDRKVNNARVLVLGITFKENCPDCRNTKVVDIVSELRDFGCRVDVYDPSVDADVVRRHYHLDLIPSVDPSVDYDAVVLAVPHKSILDNIDFDRLHHRGTIIFDVKGALPRKLVDARL